MKPRDITSQHKGAGIMVENDQTGFVDTGVVELGSPPDWDEENWGTYLFPCCYASDRVNAFLEFVEDDEITLL